jgi:hypothetical protein
MDLRKNDKFVITVNNERRELIATEDLHLDDAHAVDLMVGSILLRYRFKQGRAWGEKKP